MNRPALIVFLLSMGLAACEPAPSTDIQGDQDEMGMRSGAPICMNNVKDDQESDTDCGGPACAKCAEDKACGGPSDCATGACELSKCVAVPTITSLTPALGPTAGLTYVLLEGQGFKAGATVTVDGKPATGVIVVAADRVIFRTPATGMAGEVDVVVQNPGGKQGTSTGGFRYHWTSVGLSAAADLVAPSRVMAIVVGDFDGDRTADVASVNLDTNNMSIFTGLGGGVFNPPVSYAAGQAPVALVMADFNGDMKPDLAAANRGSGSVSVFINKGDGTFKPNVDYMTGGKGPCGVVAVDLDNDMKPDLAVVAPSGTAVLSVLINRGDGTGTFNARVDYPTAGGAGVTLAAGDFNGDMRPELVVSNDSLASVSVFPNKGDGTFDTRVDLTVPSTTNAVTTGDFNGDRKLDLAVTARAAPSGLIVLRGKGDGTFEAAQTTPSTMYLHALVAADVNSDGWLDVVASSIEGPAIFLGQNDGTFNAPTIFPRYSEGRSIWVADLNSDGKLDFVSAHASPQLRVWLGTAM